MANRWGIPKEVEELVLKRDSKCVYCGCEFTSPKVSYKSRPSWEHIINDIRINCPDNIALCCSSCNASKGTNTIEEWLNSEYCFKKEITIDSVAPLVRNQIEKKPNV